MALSTLACTGSGDDYASPPAALEAPDATTHEAGNAGAPDGTAPLDGSDTDGGEAGLPPPSTVALRLANWSPDAPGVDFCIAPHGTSAFQGPLLARLAAAIEEGGTDAGPSAIPFPQASAYVLVAPGTYDARLVVGGAADCATSLVADAPAPPLAAGQALTVALIGSAQPDTLTLVTYPDDTAPPPTSTAPPAAGAAPSAADAATLPSDAAPPPGKISVRAIHAAPSLAILDVGATPTSGGALAAPFFISMNYKSSSVSAANAGAGKFDVNGYATSKPLSMTNVVARPSGAPNNSATAPDVFVASGAVVTFVVVDPIAPTTTSPAAQIIQCVDNAGSIGLTGSCSVISQ